MVGPWRLSDLFYGRQGLSRLSWRNRQRRKVSSTTQLNTPAVEDGHGESQTFQLPDAGTSPGAARYEQDVS